MKKRNLPGYAIGGLAGGEVSLLSHVPVRLRIFTPIFCPMPSTPTSTQSQSHTSI